jgi:hypothetical protein
MRRSPTPEAGAILLGLASYVALVGWLIVLQLFAGLLLVAGGASTPIEPSSADPLVRQVVVVAVLFASGYVTGRASQESPTLNAALLGVVLYVLVTLFYRVLWAGLDVSVPVDVASEFFRLARAVLAAFVGGTAAQWHMRTRGAKRVSLRELPRKNRGALFVLAILPFVFLALTYRP